jgi:hypothetical protein
MSLLVQKVMLGVCAKALLHLRLLSCACWFRPWGSGICGHWIDLHNAASGIFAA